MRETTEEQTRATLASRLRARRAEIEQATVTRLYSIADPTDAADPEYLHGLRSALAASLEYGFAAVENGETSSPLLPPVLLSQARLAARNGVSLDTVLRRYFAGFTLFGDFVLQEAEAEVPLRGTSLHRLLQTQTVEFDRLLSAVSEEYVREAASQPGSRAERRVAQVKRLLDGELLDTRGLDYDFHAHHLGVVVAGAGGAEFIRALARDLDRRLLLVPAGEGTVWGWLGGRTRIDLNHFERTVSDAGLKYVSLAVGEPGEDLVGWQLTHRQARAALPMALRSAQSLLRYSEVALLSAVLRDETLMVSLRRSYLDPLANDRDGGATMRDTLRAYFAAERNVSSAAAALGVSRQAVAKRLRVAEEALGRPLGASGIELETALRLDEFIDSSIGTHK